jgi:hypothetical protein
LSSGPGTDHERRDGSAVLAEQKRILPTQYHHERAPEYRAWPMTDVGNDGGWFKKKARAVLWAFSPVGVVIAVINCNAGSPGSRADMRMLA